MKKDETGMNNDAVYIVTQTIDDFSKTSKKLPSLKVHNLTPRSNRPFVCIDSKDDQCVFFQEVIAAKLNDKRVTFSRPNEISLSLNIATKSLEKAQEIRKKIVRKIGMERKKDIYDAQVNEIYDYLEEVQKTIVFGYKAIESLCNTAIPNDYTYKKELNKKGIYEVYNKFAIERWLSTSEKVAKILPDIYACQSPTDKPFWGHFKKLEDLRDRIIHNKSNSTSDLLSELLSSDIGKYINSCQDLLVYFYKLDKGNPLFPIIPTLSELNVIEWEDMGESFKVVV